MSPGVGERRVRHPLIRSCVTMDSQVALEGSGYVERVCGVEFDRTRRDVVSDFQHLVNLKFEFS